MGAVSSTIEHHYWVEATTNTSLVQTTNEINHALSEEAIQEQNNCGQIIIGLIKKAIKEKYGWTIQSFEICPYMLLTMPKFDKSTSLFQFYSNWEHYNDDETSDEIGSLITELVADVDNPPLTQYFAETRAVFPEYNKERYPLPTTCCWSLHDPESMCALFSHKQHFIITEAGVSFDISSDTMKQGERQLGGTFYGKVPSHLTSCSVWVNEEDGFVSTINPGVSVI